MTFVEVMSISVVTLYIQPVPGYNCTFVLDKLLLLKGHSVVKYFKKEGAL